MEGAERWQQNLIAKIVVNKVYVGTVKTKNRKSAIHTGMLRALDRTTEKGKTMTEEGVTILALMLWLLILIRPGRY